MGKTIEYILMLATSFTLGLIPWARMSWPMRIAAALTILVYLSWLWVGAYREWKEIKARPRKEHEPINSISILISYPMLVAIVFGVIGIVWILWAAALS